MGACELFRCHFFGIEPQTGVEPASSITAHRVEAYADTGALILMKFKSLFMNSFRNSFFVFLNPSLWRESNPHGPLLPGRLGVGGDTQAMNKFLFNYPQQVPLNLHYYSSACLRILSSHIF